MKKIMIVCAICVVMFLANGQKEAEVYEIPSSGSMIIVIDSDFESPYKDSVTPVLDSDADGVPQGCDHNNGECNFRK